MVKVLMHGCNGRMGQMITSIVKESEDMEIVAGVDIFDQGKNEYPVFSSIAECNVDFDVVIDFSTAKVVDSLLDFCVANNKPCVLCTT